MSSTERFEAASISITSIELPAAIVTQESQTPQGVRVGPVDAVQRAGEDLRHRRLAGTAGADEEVGVVDAPRSIALLSVRTTCSWPTTSANHWGR